MTKLISWCSPVFLALACTADRAADTCDSGSVAGSGADTGDSGELTPGLDLSARISICPVWSGIPDTLMTTGSFELVEPNTVWGGTAFMHLDTMAWWNQDAGYTHTGGPGLEIWSGTQLFQQPDAADSRYVEVGERHFDCDEEGYWLIEETRAYQGVGEDGSVGPGTVLDGVVCEKGSILLIPPVLEIGATWSSSCTGYLWGGNSTNSDGVHDFTFTVTEMRAYTTEAGTWEAAHIQPLDFDAGSHDILQWGSLLGGSDGFWVGRGVGILTMKDPHLSSPFLRTAAH